MSFQFSMKRTARLLKQTADGWLEDNALRLSAALAYYSIFSIAPLLIIAIAIAGWVFGQEAAHGLVADQLRGFVGRQGAEGLEGMIRSASHPTGSALAGTLSAVALLFGASGVFGQLKDALNTIWEVRAKPGLGVATFVRERLLSFGMVLVIGFLLLVSLALTTLIAAAAKYLGGFLPISEVVITLLGSLVSLGVVAVLFAAIFKVLPDVQLQWRDVWIAAGVTAVLFEIGKLLLGFYLGRESTASAYGAAGSIVLVLLWVYYASLILFFGVEFTKVYAEATGGVIAPKANAEPVTAEKRAQQGLTAPDAFEPPAPAPRREVLALALRQAPVRRGEEEPLTAAERFVEAHVGAVLLGAVASGLLAGLVGRGIEQRLARSPVGEIKHGTRALLGLGAAAVAAWLERTRAKARRSLPRAGREAASAVRHARKALGEFAAPVR